jgi:Tfp pilus assembly protein PilE
MIIRLRNRKAFILGEFTLKIIIAIACILILLYLLFALYSTYTEKSKIEQAKGALDRIDGKINEALQSETGRAEDVIYQPKSWAFVYYSSGGPDACEEKSCLCICKKAGFFSNQRSSCTSNGECRKFSSLKSADSFAIDEPVDLVFSKVEGGVVIQRK